MNAGNGRALKLFLGDGSPNGLLTAEIMNRAGHVVASKDANLTKGVSNTLKAA